MATPKSQNPHPQSLSPSTSGRRSSNVCNSPEFEFWKVRNPSSFPQPNLLSADQLFFDGVLLPLHLLHHHTPNPSHSQTLAPDPEPGPSPAITDPTTTTSFSSSKRWKDIFRKTEKNNNKSEENNKPKTKTKKEKKKSANGGSSSPELNINIWPFSRSRSAGNASTRPKILAGATVSRKVNSAPCSRSNSAGESKSRKWPSSPGRTGVHVGRSSPVWQVRRAGSNPKNAEPASRRSKTAAAAGGGAAKARVLNLNVPMCIGYRHPLSCRTDDKAGDVTGDGDSADAGNRSASNAAGGGGTGNIFNLRSLFTKKSMVTSH